MFYDYIILMENNQLYTGFTEDIFTNFHNHITKRNGVLYISYIEQHKNKNVAMKRKKEIKNYHRSKKLALINSIDNTYLVIISHLISSMKLFNLKDLILSFFKISDLYILKDINDILFSNQLYISIIDSIIDENMVSL